MGNLPASLPSSQLFITILTISKCRGRWCYHTVVSHLWSFSSCRTEALEIKHLSLSSVPDPGNHHSPFCTIHLTPLRTSYKWTQAVFVFCDWFISLSIMSSRFIHIVGCDKSPSFLRLNNTFVFIISSAEIIQYICVKGRHRGFCKRAISVSLLFIQP